MSLFPSSSWNSSNRKKRRAMRCSRHSNRVSSVKLRVEGLEDRILMATWTALAHLAPEAIGTMMQLSDGTVMAQEGGGSPNFGTTNHWFKLTPDASGSYQNGTWSSLASMSATRQYYGSNVLPSGKVFIQGGEYSSAGGETATGETYNPLTNTWAANANAPFGEFGDDPTELLPNGKILSGYINDARTNLYDPATNTWTATGTKLNSDQSSEESWVQLPGGKVLSYDVWSSISSGVGHAQVYNSSTGTWSATGNVPGSLLTSSSIGYEMGPAVLLPDGRVFQIGALAHTAIYTPSTNSWVAGPDIPGVYGADDAPAAILPNGQVIFLADKGPTSGTFSPPTHMFDFDPTTNTITDITNSLPAALRTELNADPSYQSRMLVLPSGELLLAPNNQDDTGNKLWIFTPDGLPNDSWKPTISSVVDNGDGSFTLTGTQLNGISEGASYGDDAEMSSNYPLVRLVDTNGAVFYGRTSSWTPGVATGSAVETVKFTAPAGVNVFACKVFVIANGIASDPFSQGISGLVYNDVNATGSRDPGDPALAGWTVYLDLHGDGQLHSDDPQTVTGPSGGYAFTNLDPGTYTVREVLKDGWAQTAPDSGAYSVTIVDNTTTVTGQDFGNTLLNPSSISGVVFNNLRATGNQDGGDPGLAGWTVYLDANNNGVLDPGERSVVTGPDGAFTIGGLEPATYIVREVPMSGWVQSAPTPPFYSVDLGAGDAATDISFGNYHPVTLSGQVFHDLNGNGVKDPGEPGLAGWTVYVDLDGSGVFNLNDPHAVTDAAGNYTIANVTPGTVTLNEVPQTNWLTTLPDSGFYTLDVVSDVNQTGLDFGNESGTITGQVFGDTNGTGIKVAGDPGLSGWQLYLDLNNTGVFAANDPTATTDSQGNYTFRGLAAGTYTVREMLQTGWLQTAPAAGFYTVTIDGPATTVSGRDFGNFKLVTISGTKYNDINGNGSRDAGEPGLAGWIIYDDLNDSGIFLPGDPFAVSNAGGSYSLTNVGPGTHHIREFLFPGWIQTGPLSGYTITTASGQNVTGRDFGDRLINPASISGQVFHDLNADGVKEDGEPGQSGWTVSIDANSNGMGQESTVTDAQGNFTLAGLMPGTYTVRETLQPNYHQSVPASGVFTITVSAGQNVTGVSFGNYQGVAISGHLIDDASGGPLAGWIVYDDVHNSGVFEQTTSTFEPDNFADNQVLNTAFPGVTLSFLGNSSNSVVALPTPAGSAGGARVFGETTGGFYSPEFYNDPSGSTWWLRINFTTPVSSVSIDAIGTTRFSGQARGLLRIYNSANVLLGTATTDNLLAGGELATLTLSRPTADIAYAFASSDQVNEGVLLDNLQFMRANEPFGVTDANGNYTITDLKPGDHILREVVQPGWAQVRPSEGFYVATLISGQSIQTGYDFGNSQQSGPAPAPAPAPRPASVGPTPLTSAAMDWVFASNHVDRRGEDTTFTGRSLGRGHVSNWSDPFEDWAGEDGWWWI
jgi:hypothetical protein